jgi:hypothetical protein
MNINLPSQIPSQNIVFGYKAKLLPMQRVQAGADRAQA